MVITRRLGRIIIGRVFTKTSWNHEKSESVICLFQKKESLLSLFW